MRNFLLAAMAAVAVFAAGIGSAVGQGDDRWMTIKNESSLEAVAIYIIPATKTQKDDCCWSRDLLGDVIDKGGKGDKAVKVRANLDDGSGACEVHIRIATRYTGWEWFFDNIDVCANDKNDREITLQDPRDEEKDPRRDKKKDNAKRLVTVSNPAKFTIEQISIIPSGKDCCWSRDLFPINGKPSSQFNLVNFDDGSGKCLFDVRIAGAKTDITKKENDKKQLEWYFFGVEVCNYETTALILKDREGEAEGRLNRLVVIENKSQFHAIAARVKPEDRPGGWSDDLLGRRVIQKGDSAEVEFDDGSGACKLDYRITRSDGRLWIGKVDACGDGPKITLDDKLRRVKITNNSYLDAFAVRAKAEGKEWAQWSRDLLGQDIISKGQSVVVDFDVDAGTCEFKYRITKRASLAKAWESTVKVCSEPPGELPTLELNAAMRKDGKLRLVTIKNESKFDAYTVHFKPSGKDRAAWSKDALGNEIIPKGRSLSVDFDDGSDPDAATYPCEFDYRITKPSGQGLAWEGKLNACSEPSKARPVLICSDAECREQPPA